MQSDEPNIFGDVVLTEPTLTFSDHLIIDGGDLNLHLIPTPGHTADHIAIYIPEISTILAGDAAEIPFPIVYNSNDLPVLRASLALMAECNAQYALYCHAPVTIGPQLLHDNIAYYDALEVACRAALERGLDATTISNVDLPLVLDCAFNAVAPTTGSVGKSLRPTHAQSDTLSNFVSCSLGYSKKHSSSSKDHVILFTILFTIFFTKGNWISPVDM